MLSKNYYHQQKQEEEEEDDDDDNDENVAFIIGKDNNNDDDDDDDNNRDDSNNENKGFTEAAGTALVDTIDIGASSASSEEEGASSEMIESTSAPMSSLISASSSLPSLLLWIITNNDKFIFIWFLFVAFVWPIGIKLMNFIDMIFIRILNIDKDDVSSFEENPPLLYKILFIILFFMAGMLIPIIILSLVFVPFLQIYVAYITYNHHHNNNTATIATTTLQFNNCSQTMPEGTALSLSSSSSAAAAATATATKAKVIIISRLLIFICLYVLLILWYKETNSFIWQTLLEFFHTCFENITNPIIWLQGLTFIYVLPIVIALCIVFIIKILQCVTPFIPSFQRWIRSRTAFVV